MFEGLDPKLPDFMRKKRPAVAAVPQPNAVSAESLDVSATALSSSVTSPPCESSQEAESSTSPEPQPGTSTGGVTPSGSQVSGSTGGRVSTRCAAKGRKRSWRGSSSSESESSSDSSSESDEEWTPGNHAVVPQTAKKTNNPSG